MSKTTQERVFPYNHKSISYQTGNPDFPVAYGLCNQFLYLRVVPPDDFLEWKDLHTEFSILFNAASGLSASDLKLVSIGVVQELPGIMLSPLDQAPVPGKRIPMNKTVPGFSTRLTHSIDLTSMIDPTGPNWVELSFPKAFYQVSGWGHLDFWKIDTLFTTEGIR